jgi:phosphoribosylaminoimidazole-succinocarboxamide synthase
MKRPQRKESKMEKIATGKTKDVYQKENKNLVLFFKDDATGDETGINPGANTVKGKIAGKGRMSFELTCYFFELLKKKGIPTHFVSANQSEQSIEVKKARLFGGRGLEFVWRQVACGSFYRRYKTFIEKEFQKLLEPVVEITLKDDEGGDPPITANSLAALGVLKESEVEELIQLTKKAVNYIKEDLSQKGLDLLDIKVEFGDIGGFALVDEVSGDSMRVSREGVVLDHKELYQAVINKHCLKS